MKRESGFPDEPRATVEVDGIPVGVLRVDVEHYSIRNECAHQGGPVCSGEVTNELVVKVPPSVDRSGGRYEAR